VMEVLCLKKNEKRKTKKKRGRKKRAAGGRRSSQVRCVEPGKKSARSDPQARDSKGKKRKGDGACYKRKWKKAVRDGLGESWNYLKKWALEKSWKKQGAQFVGGDRSPHWWRRWKKPLSETFTQNRTSLEQAQRKTTEITFVWRSMTQGEIESRTVESLL